MAAIDTADNENELRVINEFLEELRDTASQLQVLVGNMRSKSIAAAEGLATLKREASNLRSHAQGLTLPMIKLVTHRFDEYVGELKEAGPSELDEIQVFVDKIEKLADGEQISEADAPAVVRALPAKRTADIDFGKIEKKNVEILLVVPEKAMSRIVERELAACGYRTSTIRDGFAAMETVVRTRPDMVIASVELGLLSGVDLGCALGAMPVTESIPFALFTSYEWGNPKLKGLPPRASLIRKGPQFGDDLAETLSRFNIT
ncbi:response regulator transcription factor [Magnetospirillum sp. 15-1]|uniref:response regulator transcription factor n=1 Tax=Magnetospirillum sp. 15-1 TaxID=1979370 RepID=UPI000BBC99AB|nr:response regulator transcription factor [Magnetospirillum sp. 15-1]